MANAPEAEEASGETPDKTQGPARVDFYLLGENQATAKLTFACRLAAKAFANKITAYLQVEDMAAAEQLDKLLWTYAQNSFVPHAIAAGDGRAAQFPVQIGAEPAPSDCRGMLISLRQTAPQDFAAYARVAEIVGADAQDKSSARQKYRFYQEQGVAPQTHKL